MSTVVCLFIAELRQYGPNSECDGASTVLDWYTHVQSVLPTLSAITRTIETYVCRTLER